MGKCNRCGTSSITGEYMATDKKHKAHRDLPVIDFSKKISSCLGCISPKSRLKFESKLNRQENCILNRIYYLIKPLLYPPTDTIKLNVDKKASGQTYRPDMIIEFVIGHVEISVIIEIDEPDHFKDTKQDKDRIREKALKTADYAGRRVSFIRIANSNNTVVEDTGGKTACIIRSTDVFYYNCDLIAEYVIKLGKSLKQEHVFLNMADTLGIQKFTPEAYMKSHNLAKKSKEVPVLPGNGAYKAAVAVGGGILSAGKGLFDLTSKMAGMAIGKTEVKICEAKKVSGDKCTNPVKNGKFCGIHGKMK